MRIETTTKIGMTVITEHGQDLTWLSDQKGYVTYVIGPREPNKKVVHFRTVSSANVSSFAASSNHAKENHKKMVYYVYQMATCNRCGIGRMFISGSDEDDGTIYESCTNPECREKEDETIETN